MTMLTWIPLSTQLPDADLTVLIALSDRDVWTGYLDGDVWRDVSGMPLEPGRVTHWMHMPEAPDTDSRVSAQPQHLNEGEPMQQATAAALAAVLCIGTKTVLAAGPMTRGEYNAYRGWNPPEGEDQTVPGYLVEYTDGSKPNDTRHAGYISWSPTEQFDNSYRPCNAMTFGLAIEALKRGHRVARAGWNGKGMWIALSGSTTEPRNIAWENFWSKQASAFARDENGGGAEVLPCILMKTADSRILMGWLASQTDMLAEDWQIVDAVETKTYADGTSATGKAPLPDLSPNEQLAAEQNVRQRPEPESAKTVLKPAAAWPFPTKGA